MTDASYDLIFRGELLPEGDAAGARAELARLLKLDDARLAQLFSGANVVVRRGADRDTAARFQQAFRQAGARLRVVPVAQADDAPAPTERPATSAASPAADAAPARKPTLAERLAAQAAAEAGVAADASAAARSGAMAPAGPASAAPEHLAAASAPGGLALHAPGARLGTPRAAVPVRAVPDFTLAPVGADLIDEDEREIHAAVLVDIEHIHLAPPGGNIPRLDDGARAARPVHVPDLDIAEPGALLGPQTEFVELPLDLSALSLAPVGERLGPVRPAVQSHVRTDHLSVEPPRP